jgi:SWIM/SEC-C metal-binding protein
MTRLGSQKRPAVVRVQTQQRADEVVELCSGHPWEVIVGVEPDKPEDITDVLKLLAPERFTARAEPQAGRNDPCPCGSGLKHKKCCLRAPQTAVTPVREP